MRNRGGQALKKVIGVGLVLVSILGVLIYSALLNPQPVSAIVSLHSITTQQSPNLQHTPTGTANVVWNQEQQTLTVKIVLTGLAPSSTHPNHIHAGSCETSDNGIVYTLAPIVADDKGDSTTTTVIHNETTGIPHTGWFVNIHNGPDLSTDLEMRPISCGDIVNFDTSTKTNQSVTLTLGPTSAPNQAVNGVATLSIKSNQLTVVLTLSGLEPDSEHQAHIHSGSCTSQGPVVDPLTVVQADDNGIGTSTTVINGVNFIPNNWYVNVHQAATTGDLGNQMGFDPIVCGNVIPLGGVRNFSRG